MRRVTAEQIAELPDAERLQFERWHRPFMSKQLKKISEARRRAESEAEDGN